MIVVAFLSSDTFQTRGHITAMSLLYMLDFQFFYGDLENSMVPNVIVGVHLKRAVGTKAPTGKSSRDRADRRT
jgi:hypothetical protein